MKDKAFIGRQKEIQQLQDCVNSEQSQLVIVYGRRRVGKSYLINEFFDNTFDFKLVGDLKLNKGGQLLNFYNELKRKTGKDEVVPKNWREAFWQLRDYLETFKDNKNPCFRKEAGVKFLFDLVTERNRFVLGIFSVKKSNYILDSLVGSFVTFKSSFKCMFIVSAVGKRIM